MPKPRITRLTDQQAALLPQIRDAWLAAGLSTAPAIAVPSYPLDAIEGAVTDSAFAVICPLAAPFARL